MDSVRIKKAVSAVLAVWMLAALFSFTASAANVINTVYSSEQITVTATVYLGEIVLDGETVLTYIYSDYARPLFYLYPNYETGEYYGENTALATTLVSMDRADFAGMMAACIDERLALNLEELHAHEELTVFDGIKLCSDADLIEGMDGAWASPAAVAALLYHEATLTSETSENAYDIDEGFRTAFEEKEQERVEVVDEPVESNKRVIEHTETNTHSSVYYTVEDGAVVKHVDTTVVFNCAAITVLYNKVELSSGATVAGDINCDGVADISDVTALLNILDGTLAQTGACDLDGSGDVDISDVTALLNLLAA